MMKTSSLLSLVAGAAALLACGPLAAQTATPPHAAVVAAGNAALAGDKSELPMVQRAAHVCVACHGIGGRSSNPQYPSIAGQQRDYLVRQLKDFRDQTRSETDTRAFMWGITALLDNDTIEGLAELYSREAPAKGHSTQPKLEAAGRKLYAEGVPGTPVRSCAACHGEKAEGQAGFPRLAGQHAGYLVRQMQAFGTPLRPHGVVMKEEVRTLTAPQRRAVAAYLQSL